MTQNPNTTAGLIQELTRQQGVMQAYLDGKTILASPVDARILNNRDWQPSPNPIWNWRDFDYKVEEPKPQPIELSVAYVNCANPNCSGEHMVAAGSEDEVRGYMQSVPEHLRSNVTFKRFIEVVEG